MDRNTEQRSACVDSIGSLSARRAWIEIYGSDNVSGTVAASLSARRAWIEIGSVSDDTVGICGRSPQGERG